MKFIVSFLMAMAALATAAKAPDERLFTQATMPASGPPFVYFKGVEVGDDGAVLRETVTSFEHLGSKGHFGRVFKWDEQKEDLANCLWVEPPTPIGLLASQMTTWLAESKSHKNCIVAEFTTTPDNRESAINDSLTFGELQEKWIASHDAVQSDDFQTAIRGSPLSNLEDHDLTMVAMTVAGSTEVGERVMWFVVPLILFLAGLLKPETPVVAPPANPIPLEDIDAWEINADGSYTPLDLESESSDSDVEYGPDGPIWVEQPDGSWDTHTPHIVDNSPDR